MPVINLTLPFINNVKAPANKHHEYYFDEKTPRFGICVSKNKISFIIKYRNKYGRDRWYTFGTFGIYTLEEARIKARSLLKDVDDGLDPASKALEDKNTITLKELVELYFDKGVLNKKASTIESDKSRFNNHILPILGNVPIVAITSANIEDLMNDIAKGKTAELAKKTKSNAPKKPHVSATPQGGMGTAVRCMQSLGAVLQFGVRRGLLSTNVSYSVKKPRSNTRDVFLSMEDMYNLGVLLNDSRVQARYHAAVNAIKLIALTGCRKNEILSLRWEYVDFANQVFRFPDTKTGKQTRPFGIMALNLLAKIKEDSQSDWVFPTNRQKNSTHLDGLLKMFKSIQQTTYAEAPETLIFNKPNVTLHTLRHSFATIAHDELGFSELTIAGLLGHHLRGTVTERYTHLIDSSQIHAADELSCKIAHAIAPELISGKVINIERRAV